MAESIVAQGYSCRVCMTAVSLWRDDFPQLRHDCLVRGGRAVIIERRQHLCAKPVVIGFGGFRCRKFGRGRGWAGVHDGLSIRQSDRDVARVKGV